VASPGSDGSLVRRFLEGDASAFDELVRRHQTRVYNLCFRILGNREDARDATQDAFMAALRKLGQFRGDAAFTTWLHRVTVNACYDELRKQRRRPMLHVVPEGEDDRPREPGPAAKDHADAIAGSMDAAAALMQIPEEFRFALVLADVQDLPYEEVGRILDVPVGTVKSRVHRGRLALARVLAVGGPGEPQDLPAPSEPPS
jgi:RNA polymerase sigma-70 factor (ECF subfamily)